MHDPKSVGERLHIARRRRALTQRELAELSNVGKPTISRIERGDFEESPRPTTVRKLADALNVEPRWLLFGEGEDTGKATARGDLAAA